MMFNYLRFILIRRKQNNFVTKNSKKNKSREKIAALLYKID